MKTLGWCFSKPRNAKNCLKALGSQEKGMEQMVPRGLVWNQPCCHFDPRFPGSRAMGHYASLFRPCSVCYSSKLLYPSWPWLRIWGSRSFCLQEPLPPILFSITISDPEVSWKLKLFSTFVKELLPASSGDLAPNATQILKKENIFSSSLKRTLQAKLFSP